MPKAYLCGSIANAQINAMTSRLLRGEDLEVFDPCEITPQNQSKTYFSEQVYERCKQAIECCDILLVFLDAYGRDSAWEIGYARGLGKYIAGIASGSSLFLEDWMVKYALDRVFVLSQSWFASETQGPDWATVVSIVEVCSLDELPSRLRRDISLVRANLGMA